MIADAQTLQEKRFGQLGDPLFIGSQRDHGSLAVQIVLETNDFTLQIKPARFNHVQRFVEDHLLALAKLFDANGGMQVDLQLAAGHIDIDRLVVICAGIDSIGSRRRGEFLHLHPHGFDAGLRLLKSLGESIVLFVCLFKLSSRLGQPAHLVFEGTDLNQELLFFALLVLHSALLRVLIGQALG